VDEQGKESVFTLPQIPISDLNKHAHFSDHGVPIELSDTITKYLKMIITKQPVLDQMIQVYIFNETGDLVFTKKENVKIKLL
jgi:hypothetical protein